MKKKFFDIKDKLIKNISDKKTLIMLGLNILLIIFSIMKFSNLAVICMIISSILILQIVRRITGSYINIPFIFVVFHVIYGITGVISVTWLDGLSSTYGYSFNIFPYCIAYALCTIFLICGMMLAYDNDNTKKIKFEYKFLPRKKRIGFEKYFLFITICGFACTVMFELINFFRVGGFSILSLGKAVYQARVDELVGTLPTQTISQVSFASLGIYLILATWNKVKIQKKLVICSIILIIPYILLLLFLGRRGPLLGYFLIMVLALSQLKPVKKITKKMVIIICLIYVGLASLYSVRHYTNLLFSNFGEFCQKFFSKENFVGSFNPGKTEFGCTFGNFNRLIVIDNYEFLYGKTYIQGLLNFIPSYVYPGEKPRMITYEFRDKYFPAKAKISSIASTAFSSILETYLNFGYFGSIIYMAYGYIIMWLDKKFKKKNVFALLFYLSIIPIIYEFHRSDFGHIVYQVVLVGGSVFLIYLFHKYIYRKYLG